MLNRKVTVIDDDKKFLCDIGKILVGGGYAPILVADARLAVDSVIQDKPDVILMDLRIFRRNGCELVNVINRVFETSRMPVIAMSESLKDGFSELLNLFGIKSYLKRPFQPLDVIWAIENEMQERNQWDSGRCLAGIKVMTWREDCAMSRSESEGGQ